MLTWEKLAEHISRMTPDQRQDNVTVRIQSMDEYFGDLSLEISGEECDVLDPNSFYIDVDA